jgi:hypothetical protein
VAEPVAEMAAPPVARDQPVEEVGQVKRCPPGEFVKRAHEPQAELLPHQDRPRHVDIRRAFAAQVAGQLVGVVEVVVQQPHGQLVPGGLLELGRPGLDVAAEHVVVAAQEANFSHQPGAARRLGEGCGQCRSVF